MTPIFNDVRDKTRDTRLAIGFSDTRDSWRTAPADFTEHELRIENHPVMQDWETDYMRLLASIACSRGGNILELGYGMGISSRFIHEHPIDRHYVVEANQDVFRKLTKFATNSKVETVPLFGFWEEITQTIPDESIDGILFDTYPLSDREIHKNHFDFFKEAQRLLKPGGIFTYYSDEINSFSQGHTTALSEAGFTDIRKQLCRVNPPTDCEYWQSDTILAPIVTKSMPRDVRTRPYGIHLMFDGYEADNKKLADVDLVYQTLNDLPDLIGMTKVGFPHVIQFKDCDIAGLSAFVFIVESHISIHTYARKGFISLDAYSCKPFNPGDVIDHIQKAFDVKKIEHKTASRGTYFPVN